MKIRFFLILTLTIITNGIIAQVQGTIKDTEGNALPYATIYIENSTQGTTTNLEGIYSFNLTAGTYRLTFQYVGYKSITKNVTIKQEPVILDIFLEPESITFAPIVVTADAEDPAYDIIRKAISKRSFHKNQFDNYSADLYIKGLIRTEDAPEKMMGMEIGDMSGILDSARNGIVYLSESKSKLYFQKPDQYKEVMYASKVAGDIDGVSFNQFSDANFSFYNEHLNFGRKLLSPIADNALSYYKYRLIGTTVDEMGNQISKIKVIPKSKNDPCFYGLIYIMDDSWRIQSTDLAFTGKASKVMIFDTIGIKQLYVPSITKETYVLFSQVMDFKMGLMTFKFGGTFSYFFSNYLINETSPENVFNNEIFKIEADANEKDSLFWNRERPVPITLEEKKDYQKKDSLEVLWNSKEYLDSIDHVNNKFKWINLLFGYTYSKTYENRYISLKSPLNTISFNPVQGYRLAADMRYRQWNKNSTSFFSIEPYLSYGFSEKRIRASIKVQKLFNSINYATIALEGGRITNQLNEINPVDRFYNAYESLVYKNNRLRIFEKDFVRLAVRKELLNGVMARGNLQYAQRRSLDKNTDHSWFRRGTLYASEEFVPFDSHNTLFGSINIRWIPGQKFMTFKDERVFRRSKWPDFNLFYKSGFRIEEDSPEYDFIKLSMKDSYLGLGLWGYLSYNIEYGNFLRKKNMTIVDHYHIQGNPFHFIASGNYLNRFKTLRNYELSTINDFGVLFSEYHFDGRLMDNIPLLRNWGIKTVVGFNAARISTQETMEASIGIEDLGIGGISIFRIDYAWSFTSDQLLNHGFYISLSNNIN